MPIRRKRNVTTDLNAKARATIALHKQIASAARMRKALSPLEDRGPSHCNTCMDTGVIHLGPKLDLCHAVGCTYRNTNKARFTVTNDRLRRNLRDYRS